MRMTPTSWLFFAIILLSCLETTASPTRFESAAALNEPLLHALDHISPDRMLADIVTLSGPQFHGRQAGTEDDRRSAAWIGARFRSTGLTLPVIGGGNPSHVPVTGLMTSVMSAPVIEAEPALRIGSAESMRTQQLWADYLPILDSPSADIQAPIVFVGYGTSDEYATVDVNQCIVLFLRGKPERAKTSVSHAEKVRLARAKGAVAYLTATGPILNAYEARRGMTGTPSAFYGQMPFADAIPGAWISTQLAETILAENNGTRLGRLRELQDSLNQHPALQSLRTQSYAALRWQTTLHEGLLANVVALLPGSEPGAIVIGAHRDHFGNQAGLLFPGADDNASGTAVMLEVGRVLATGGRRPKRTVLFVSFSGEEKDLLGSRLYVSRPAVPLDRTVAMINVDHAGVGNGRLTVGITGLDKSLAAEAGQSAGLSDKLDLYGFFPGGDHVPFKEAGVPTITVVSGGAHPHFHQPSDTADTIDPEILRNTARYVLTLAWQLANAP